MDDEKVTVKVAAKALKVSARTVRRYIEKGIISKVKEGDRTYVSMSDVRKLIGQAKADMSQVRPQNKDTGVDMSGAVISIDRTHYEALLTRLGALEGEKKYLLEYKATNEELKRTVAELEAELARESVTWWKRLFSKK